MRLRAPGARYALPLIGRRTEDWDLDFPIMVNYEELASNYYLFRYRDMVLHRMQRTVRLSFDVTETGLSPEVTEILVKMLVRSSGLQGASVS